MKRQTLKQTITEAIARNDHNKLVQIAAKLSIEGSIFKGQQIIFTYDCLKSLFTKHGFNENDFPQLMDDVDHFINRRSI